MLSFFTGEIFGECYLVCTERGRKVQNEITVRCPVPDISGSVRNPGWARTEIMEYRRKNIKAAWFKRKEWDYYLFTNDEFGVALTISDLGYIGMLSVSFLDFKNESHITRSEIVPLPAGKRFGLGRRVHDSNCSCHTKRLDMKFGIADEGFRKLVCEYRNFDGDKTFSCELHVYEQSNEAMYIATPWAEKSDAFYYNCKVNCLECEGIIRYGDRTLEMKRENSLGVLDWGRGVWTYDNTWYWGTGSGRVDGAAFGFNLGYGFSDRSAATENAVFYKGRVHKLSEVTFIIPEDESGKKKYTEKWQITSDNNRFEGEFVPIFDRCVKMDYKLISSNQHQVFGRMTGFAILDDNTRIDFKDFICSLEVVRNRY